MNHLDELFLALRCTVPFLLVTAMAAAAGACLDRPAIQSCDDGLCPAGWSCSADGDCQAPTACVVAPAESHFIGADGNAEDDSGSTDRRSDEDRGDTTLDQGEEGDDSIKNGGVSILAGCGDGAVDAGEECDDGNAIAGDGCSASCQEEFGYDCVAADFSDGVENSINASSLPGPNWQTSKEEVTQLVACDPAVYLTNLPATGAGEIQFEITVFGSAEDFLGIVLGYDPGELFDPNAEYLLIDWDGESNGTGSGLTLSLVHGPTQVSDLTEHTGSVTPLLTEAPEPTPEYWENGKLYIWKLSYRETHLHLTIEVDARPIFGIDVDADDVGLTGFPAGNLGFYVFGQDNVIYTLLSPRGSRCTFEDGDDLSGTADADEDNDGIPDALENVENIDPDDDADHDGAPNYLDASDRGDGTDAACLDADGNRFCDTLDPLFDMDEDGNPNHRDLDTDGDSIPDLVESGHNGVDEFGDGILDGPVGDNGIPDHVEFPFDSGQVNAPWNTDDDVDDAPDFRDTDSDDDNIRDADEAGDGDPTTLPVDTNLDDTPDFRDTDSDGDNIRDVDEAGDGDPATPPVDTNLDGTPDFRDTDSDDDNIRDVDEAGDGDPATPPADTDRDGTPDFRDPDSDDDELDDGDDNCRLVVNPDQQDLDRDLVGDVCDCTVGQGGCSSVDSSSAGAVLLVLLALAPSVGRRKRRPWLRARHRPSR